MRWRDNASDHLPAARDEDFLSPFGTIEDGFQLIANLFDAYRSHRYQVDAPSVHLKFPFVNSAMDGA